MTAPAPRRRTKSATPARKPPATAKVKQPHDFMTCKINSCHKCYAHARSMGLLVDSHDQLIEVRLATATELLRMRTRDEAKRIMDGLTWKADLFRSSRRTVGASLATVRSEGETFMVHNMINARGNVSIAGSNGVGKTILGLNLMRSLVDKVPFLGAPTALPFGYVTWWNLEMDADDWNDYLRPMRLRDKTSPTVQHLRGVRVALLNDAVAEEAVKVLTDSGSLVWIVDSWRRLCAMSGLSENKNEDVELLTTRIDEIKREAGVHVFIALAHTGRVRAEEGDEHARGATAFDDWVDARWTYVMPDMINRERYLSTPKVRGVRDEDLILSQQVLMDDRNLVSLGTLRRSDNISRDFMLELVDVVTGEPGLNTTEAAKALGLGIRNGRGKEVGRHLAQAEKDQLIHSDPGPNRSKLWSPGPKEPQQKLSRPKRG